MSKRNWTFLGLQLYAVFSLGSMATMSVGAAVFFLAFLYEGHSTNVLKSEAQGVLQNPFTRRLLVASTLLSIAILGSLLNAVWHPLVFSGMAPEVRLPADLGKIWYLYFPILLALGWTRLSETERSKVILTWLWTFSILTFVGLQQIYTGWPRTQENPEFIPYYHPILLIGHHLSMASIWIFPFFAVLDWTMRSRTPFSRPFTKPVLIGLVLLNFVLLMFEFSRTLWIALPTGISLYFFLRLRGRARFIMIALAVLLVGAASQTPVVQGRLHSQMGVLERLSLWKMNAEFVQARPLLGIGFGKTGEVVSHALRERFPLDYAKHFVGHAHNLALEILAGTGLLGALTWLYWFFAALYPAWTIQRRLKSAPSNEGLTFPTGLLCAWVVFLINSLTQVNFWEGKVMHQVAWITGLSLSWVMTQTIVSRGKAFSAQLDA